jgi:hypothetical protein
LLKQLTKRVVERVLEAELTAHLAFGDLWLDGAQLLGHKRVQRGPHRQTFSAVEHRRQGFEVGEREP